MWNFTHDENVKDKFQLNKEIRESWATWEKF